MKCAQLGEIISESIKVSITIMLECLKKPPLKISNFFEKLQRVFDLLVWRTQSSIAPCVIDSNEIFWNSVASLVK